MRLALIAAFGVVGCDGSSATRDAAPDIDASSAVPCWPDLVQIPKGSATVGTGYDTFQEMPEDLPLEYGIQDGFMLIANAKMTGLDPGNPNDPYDVSNPRTRIRAYFDETNIPLNYDSKCAFRSPYVPMDSGDYMLIDSVAVIFEVCWRSSHLFDKRVRVELELIDKEGGYKTDVKLVTIRAPLGPHAVDDGPGCIH